MSPLSAIRKAVHYIQAHLPHRHGSDSLRANTRQRDALGEIASAYQTPQPTTKSKSLHKMSVSHSSSNNSFSGTASVTSFEQIPTPPHTDGGSLTNRVAQDFALDVLSAHDPFIDHTFVNPLFNNRDSVSLSQVSQNSADNQVTYIDDVDSQTELVKELDELTQFAENQLKIHARDARNADLY